MVMLVRMMIMLYAVQVSCFLAVCRHPKILFIIFCVFSNTADEFWYTNMDYKKVL